MFRPMGASDYNPNKELIFPVIVQPKIDGNRSIYNNGILYSRTMKPFELQHITAQLDKLKLPKNIYIDGEIYIPHHKSQYVRGIIATTSKLHSEISKVCYVMFDYYDSENPNETYIERYRKLSDIFGRLSTKNNIRIIRNKIANNKTQIQNIFEKVVRDDGEGIIIRNPDGLYKYGSKTSDVMKSKDVKIGKFQIVGFEEATGKNAGTVIWRLKCTKTNKTFMSRPLGTLAERRQLFKDAHKYIGSIINVKYYLIDSNGCVMRNPISMNID